MDTLHQMILSQSFLYFRGVYNCRMHPKVKNGQMTEAQVFEEFLVNFGDVDRNG